MTRLVLAGNAVTAGILLAYLADDSRYEVVGLTVDDAYAGTSSAPSSLPSTPLSGLRQAFSPQDCRILMAVGYDDLNRVRESLFLRLKGMGYGMETFVHPRAFVHPAASLGEGAVVLPGAVIEPHATIGSNTMVWCNATLAHHSRVGDNCWVAAGAVVSGGAGVGRNSFLGVHATIVNKVAVGDYNVIGAAALVSRDTKAATVHLARSAEPLRYSADDYVKHFGI